jgi:hypothetical protein
LLKYKNLSHKNSTIFLGCSRPKRAKAALKEPALLALYLEGRQSTTQQLMNSAADELVILPRKHSLLAQHRKKAKDHSAALRALFPFFCAL